MQIKRYKYIFAIMLVIAFCQMAWAANEFTAKTTMTVDQHYYNKWAQSIGYYIPPITAATKVYKGEAFDIRYMLINMSLTEIKECDVTADIELKGPTGKVFLSKKDTKVLKEMIFNQSLYYVSSSYERVTFGVNDALGKYHLKVTFHDKIGKKDSVSEADIELIASGSDKLTLTDQQLERLLFTYYQTPDSHRIMDMFKVVDKYLAQDEAFGYIFGPMFRTFLRDNAYLLPDFQAYIKQLPAEKRKKLYPLIKAVSLDYKDLIGKLEITAEEKKAIEAVIYPDITDENVNQLEIDMLSADFYVSGELFPVQQLINVAKLANLTDQQASNIGRYAVRTIASNCKSHKLFKAYCMYIVNGDLEMDDATRETMQMIFDNTN